MRIGSGLGRQAEGEGAKAAARRRRAGLAALLYLVLQLLLGLGLPAAAAPPMLDRFGNPICSDAGPAGHASGGKEHADRARCCAALCFAAATAAPPPPDAAAIVLPAPEPLRAATRPPFEIARPPLADSPRLSQGPPLRLPA